MNTLFRISKGAGLSELVGSVDCLTTFACQHGPGRYDVEELSDALFPGSTVTARVWGSVTYRDDGQVVTTRRPLDPEERIRRPAFHEAGHAVMLLESGISIDTIEITPDGDEVGGGVDMTEPLKKAEPGINPRPATWKTFTAPLTAWRRAQLPRCSRFQPHA